MKSPGALKHSSRLFIFILTVCFVRTASAEPSLLFDIIQGSDVDTSNVSAIGSKVLRDFDQWKIGRSEHFIVLASNLRELSSTVEEAEYAYRRIGQWLGLTNQPPEKMLVVMVEDGRLWRKLMRGHGLRHDSLAMQIGHELYLKNDPEQNKRPDRIAHEIIHARLAQSLPAALPLCIEEGIAGYYGWLCSVEFGDLKDMTLYRKDPPLDESTIFPMPELMSITAYPAKDQEARAFYRQSEELIRVVESRISREEMPALVRQMATNDVDLIGRMRESCRLSEQQWNEVVNEVRRRCLQASEP
jgi:hypothetical protein